MSAAAAAAAAVSTKPPTGGFNVRDLLDLPDSHRQPGESLINTLIWKSMEEMLKFKASRYSIPFWILIWIQILNSNLNSNWSSLRPPTVYLNGSD